MKRLITDEIVATEYAAGRRRIAASPQSAVVTPAAWTRARELGVVIDAQGNASGPGTSPPRSRSSAPPRPPRAAAAGPDPGSADKTTDASGVVVVRGRSVQLGTFNAGPDKQIGLTDLITGKDGSPMTAGIMSFGAADSFPWSLGYDEIDLVLEGVLQVHIGGRIIEGRAGDVLYIPKGSSIVFATPNRTRVFYVTHPADWAAPNPSTRPG